MDPEAVIGFIVEVGVCVCVSLSNSHRLAVSAFRSQNTCHISGHGLVLIIGNSDQVRFVGLTSDLKTQYRPLESMEGSDKWA